MFSKACEYGIKAIIYIATQSIQGKRVKLGDIASEIGSPEAFTAKILQDMAKMHLIDSHTGPNGGFEIQRSQMKRVRLSHIVSAIDGDSIYNGCGLGLQECSKIQPCPVHDKFVKVRDELKRMLETTSVHDLAMGLNEGNTFLKR